jgi:hypothetical protein
MCRQYALPAVGECDEGVNVWHTRESERGTPSRAREWGHDPRRGGAPDPRTAGPCPTAHVDVRGALSQGANVGDASGGVARPFGDG